MIIMLIVMMITMMIIVPGTIDKNGGADSSFFNTLSKPSIKVLWFRTNLAYKILLDFITFIYYHIDNFNQSEPLIEFLPSFDFFLFFSLLW